MNRTIRLFIINNSFVYFSLLFSASTFELLKSFHTRNKLFQKKKRVHKRKTLPYSILQKLNLSQKKMDAQYSHISLPSSSSYFPFEAKVARTNQQQQQQQTTIHRRQSIHSRSPDLDWWKQRRVSPRHVADSKKSAAHPLCNEFSEFPAHNQSTSARPPFPPTFRLIYRRRHRRLHHHHHHLRPCDIADVVRQASARIASCSPREFKSGQCAVNAASFTTVDLLRSSADVAPPVAVRVLEPVALLPLMSYKCCVRIPLV